MTDFAAVQSYMRDQRIDGWLVYDFRCNNPVLSQLLPGKRWTTRRALLFVPSDGEPVLLAHGIDARQFDGVSVRRELYLSWRDLNAWLSRIAEGRSRIAMEYSPGGALPVVSIADAGTVEFVRSLGVEVVSSANLMQISIATWSAEALERHMKASRDVNKAKDDAFALIKQRLAGGQAINEYEAQQFIMKQFAAAGLEASEPPIVAVNAHSGDPHYEPTAQAHAPIKKGDWVLIDLWARAPGNENVFSDITWVGCAGQPTPQHREVFETVRRARDAAVERVQSGWKKGESMQGWQLDDAARDVIIGAGYENAIRHRTGHSLSPGEKVHGMGFNLDNLETRDTRCVLANLGFTIEPGIYLPDFGVRLEINMFVDPSRGPIVTSEIQKEIIPLG